MHARDGDWDAVVTRMRELIDEHGNIPDEYDLQAVFVTGSLAYGGGVPGESDADLVLGDNREQSDDLISAVGTVIQLLQDYEGEFAELLGLPVTTVHIVEVVPARRTPHRAMELQHQGGQLARQYDVDKSIEMKVYDVLTDEVLDDARRASY